MRWPRLQGKTGCVLERQYCQGALPNGSVSLALPGRVLLDGRGETDEKERIGHCELAAAGSAVVRGRGKIRLTY